MTSHYYITQDKLFDEYKVFSPPLLLTMEGSNQQIPSHLRLSRLDSAMGLPHWIYACYAPASQSIIDPMHIMVERISVYKRHFFIQHEAIVATLSGLGPHHTYILMDRTVNFESHRELLSVDRIREIPSEQPPWESRSSAVWTINFHGNEQHLNFVQLAFLASAVSGTSEHYHGITRNCFWFTRVMREIVERIAHEQGAGISTTPEQRFLHVGHCFGIKLDHLDDAEVEHIYQSYQAEYTSFQQGLLGNHGADCMTTLRACQMVYQFGCGLGRTLLSKRTRYSPCPGVPLESLIGPQVRVSPGQDQTYSSRLRLSKLGVEATFALDWPQALIVVDGEKRPNHL
ncbi:hypothetical protein AX15_001872 [Amanita polypyramis BW_CC]|nr:hypothetical protein AX15_001872 [Amanita polypyramis BW_CC]